MQRMALGLVFLVACGGDPDPHHDDDHHHHEEGCDIDAPLDAYVQGIAKTGANGVTIAVVSADPAPPDVGVNTWQLEVTTADGAPGEEAEVVVRPFMPQHGHGSSPAEFAASRGDGDAWDVPPMDLFMPGVWEVTIELLEGDEPVDEVVFRFCLEG